MLDPVAMRELAERGEARRRAIGATPEAIEAAMARERAAWDALPRWRQWLQWQGRRIAALPILKRRTR